MPETFTRRRRRPLLEEMGRQWGLTSTVRSHRRRLERLERAPKTGDVTMTRVSVMAGGAIPSHDVLSGISVDDHHSNVNDPSAGEKAALPGTSGTPGAGNKYVTNADPRNTDARVPTGAAGGDLGGTYPNPIVGSHGSGKHTGSAIEATVEFVIGGGVDVITTGIQVALEVPFACTIKAARLVALKESGALKVDIWKDTYANWPPTDADSICGTAEPEIIATGNKAEDTTLTGWTTSVSKGDWLMVNVDSVTTITLATLALSVERL